MTVFTRIKKARLSRSLLFAVFFCMAFAAGAQASGPASGSPAPSQEGKAARGGSQNDEAGSQSSPQTKKNAPDMPQGGGSPSSGQQKADTPPQLYFSIRAAFALTPAMVKTLQTKTAAAAPKEREAEIVWGEQMTRSQPFSSPLDVRMEGQNIVVLIQVLPVGMRPPLIDLFVQGQIWVVMPDNSLSYKTTAQMLSFPLGSGLYFYPLGADTKTGASVAVEIRVDRQANQ